MIHDLRAQLVTITAVCDDLTASGLTRQHADDLERIRRAAGLMAARVDDALVDDGARAAAPEPVDVGNVVVMLADQLRPLAAMRGCSLVATVVPGACVLGREPELVSAVQNLVDNAIRHSPAGGVVRCGVTRRRGMVRISVTDSGPGFAEADRERLLRPRERGTTGGAGLGLAIASSTARSQGGQLTVTDAPEGGARVILDLPATAVRPRRRRRQAQRRTAA